MYKRLELGGDKVTDQEIIDVLEKEVLYLKTKEVVSSSDPPKDIDLIDAIELSIRYMKDYKNLVTQLAILEHSFDLYRKDNARLRKERDSYINQLKPKPVNSVKIQYEDGSFETIYKGNQEGE